MLQQRKWLQPLPILGGIMEKAEPALPGTTGKKISTGKNLRG
jgi:hypothetical protein